MLASACGIRPLEAGAGLHDRMAEAEREGRLGEIDGLKVSLADTEDKLAQIGAHCPPSGLPIPTVRRSA